MPIVGHFMNSLLTVLLTLWIIALLVDSDRKNKTINQKQHSIDSLQKEIKFKDIVIKDYQSRL